MTDDQHDIVTILVKYALHEPLSEGEERMLVEWRQRSPEHAVLPEQFRDRHWLAKQRRRLHTPPTEAMWADIRGYIDESGEPAPVAVMGTRRRVGLAWYPAAVMLCAVLIYGGMRWRQARRLSASTVAASVRAGYKALLALDDGSMIVLDTLKKGAIIEEGMLRVRKADSNSYVYTAGELGDRPARHRLTVASGVLRVQWPDGSSAWVKGGTRLDYALDLRSAEVRLAGEAWFRIAPDAGKPVTVETPDGTLARVLGTSFDVQATTVSRVALFSGSVRVVAGADSLLLRPGSQVSTGGAYGLRVEGSDSNAVLAWMRPAVGSPYFDFSDADLLQMLPEIAAWYRVQVVNPRRLRGAGITGGFSRKTPLPVLVDELRQVEGSYVKIELRADTIYISPLRSGG